MKKCFTALLHCIYATSVPGPSRDKKTGTRKVPRKAMLPVNIMI
jgi:hypothetical protein